MCCLQSETEPDTDARIVETQGLDADFYPSDRAFRWQLDRLLAAADRAVKNCGDGPKSSDEDEEADSKGSLFESFVGNELATTYQKHFRRKPTIRRYTNGRVSSAFISFCLAVLSELQIAHNGKPYSAAAVARALSAARNEKLRSKGGLGKSKTNK
jgi:hypothetical protein